MVFLQHSPPAFPRPARPGYVGLIVMLLGLIPASGLQVTNYSSTQNDRFSGGFPTVPVTNSSGSFVGTGRDWSGVGWAATDGTKGFGFVSPSHYLVARHHGGAANVTIFDTSGYLRSTAQSTVEATNYGIIFQNETVGDLSLGTLTTSPPKLARYGALDLNPSSSTNQPSNYLGKSLLVYGRGPNGTTSPRLGSATITSVTASGLNQYFTTSRTDLQLETGDSGSPAFVDWTNPNGTAEPAIIGNNAAINDVDNFHNFLGTSETFAALNALMTNDGRALRIVGNPSYTWQGSSSTSLFRNSAWGIGGNPNAIGATSDLFVRFDPSTATSRSINVDTSNSLRGIYFKSSAATSDGFSFSGTSTLTLGRGGLTNYDTDTQTFSANLKLGDHQLWDVGPGRIAAGNLDTNDCLLEIRAGAGSSFSGAISGTGGLALDSGNLLLSGTSTYSGPTWVHSGTMTVTGALTGSSSLQLTETAVLSGSGQVPPVSGSGLVAPGTNQAVLTAPSLDPSSGLDFALEFTTASAPDFGTAASSLNDLVRLTGPTPISANLSASNRMAIYLDVPELTAGQIFRGGIFTDTTSDFFGQITGATIEIYLRDATGSVPYNGQTYRAYAEPLQLILSTESQTANFASGSVSGRIMQIAVIPAATTYDQWQTTAFPPETSTADRLAGADPNGDGISNLQAYAYRLDPLTTPASGLPNHSYTPPHDPSDGEIVFHFRRNRTASDLTYTVQVSDTLADMSWSDYTDPLKVIDANPDGDGGAEWVEARVSILASETRKFVRLKVMH